MLRVGPNEDDLDGVRRMGTGAGEVSACRQTSPSIDARRTPRTGVLDEFECIPARSSRRLRFAAYVMIAAGASMAVMPFVGPLVGVPFDGGEAWMLDRNRAVLHLLPGVLGVLLGVALVLAASRHRRSAADDAPPARVAGLARAGMAVALWNALGPWLLTPLLGHGDSALMFHGIAGFQSFSTLHQVLLELGCHWFPGTVSLLAAWTAYRVGASALSGGTDGGHLASYPRPAAIGRGR